MIAGRVGSEMKEGEFIARDAVIGLASVALALDVFCVVVCVIQYLLAAKHVGSHRFVPSLEGRPSFSSRPVTCW